MHVKLPNIPSVSRFIHVFRVVTSHNGRNGHIYDPNTYLKLCAKYDLDLFIVAVAAAQALASGDQVSVLGVRQ